jgi:Cu+-exporting ATPase
VFPAPGVSTEQLLRWAGALEAASEHPIARAVADQARDRAGTLAAVSGFGNHEGLGVSGIVDGHAVVVGRRSWLEEQVRLAGGQAEQAAQAEQVEQAEQAGQDRPATSDGPSEGNVAAELAEAAEQAQHLGHTPVWVGWDGRVRGVLTVADMVKASSAAAVRELRALGLRPVLLTGDNRRAAEAVAAEVGIDEVIADVLPAGKVAAVRELQRQGRKVAMAGDGINDAAALAAADLGLAMGTGADVAIQASDLTLVRGDLRAAADAVRLSRATLRTIKANLFWAFGYNVAALPLAASGLLNPVIAGAAMAASSVFVVSNSLRLRRFDPTPRTG